MIRNDSVQEILDGVLSNELFHHVFFMGSLSLSIPSSFFLFLSLPGDMNYRITFDPTTPADVANTKVQPKSDNNRTAPQKKPSTSSATDIDDIDVNDDDDEDIDEIDPDDTSRERDVALVYEQIADENWTALLARDELNRELEAGRVLNGYSALKPSFPPTFKVRLCHLLHSTLQ